MARATDTNDDEQNKTIEVNRDTVIRAAYGQYMTSKGGSHVLHVEEEVGITYLEYAQTDDRDYTDDDAVLAREVIGFVEFEDDLDAGVRPEQAVTHTGELVDELDIDGETYDVREVY